MTKKFLLILMMIFLSTILTGCWNYVGLDHMTIVMGIAIDKDDDNYHVTCEIVDMVKSNKTEGIKTEILESDGSTIFDAIRNAKKRITNKLYFANTQVIIINEKLAKEEGINSLTNWFIRDAEVRETLKIIISKEKQAKDILFSKGLGNAMTSYELAEIISDDKTVTDSTIDITLFDVYNTLNSKGVSLVLPALHLTTNNNQMVNEVDGIAIFEKDKMLGYLSSIETKYFLFAINKVEGGILPIATANKNDISLEISKSQTKTAYSYKNDKLKFTINIKTEVFLGEDMSQTGNLSSKELKEIKQTAEDKINKEVKDVINKIQVDYNSDILGFGQIVYRSNPKLWKKLSKDWKSTFKTIEVEVKSDITIVNMAFIK